MLNRSELTHLAYLVAIAVKGFDGLLELVAGFVLALAGPDRLYAFAVWVTAPELASHPASRVAHFIRHGAQNLTQSTDHFAVIYLMIHGILKVAIAINLFVERLWIFPVATIVLTGFVSYMGYRLSYSWSYWLFAFLIFDLFTIALVLNEWRMKAKEWSQRKVAA